MAIDTSMYSNQQPVSVPNPMNTAQQALQLSNAQMQQAQMVRQVQTQTAVRQAYLNNTDQSGQVDRQGVLADLANFNPQLAQETATGWAQQDKAQAEAKSAQLDAVQKTLNITGPAFDYMAKLPEDQRAAAWPKIMDQLKSQGVDTSRMDHDYDPQLFKQSYGTWQASKPSLENQLTQAQIGKTQSETGQVAQKRLQDYQGKFQDDEQVKDANNTLTQGNSVMTAINDATKNPASKQALGFMLVRLTADGKRAPSEQIEKQALAGDFGDKIQQMFQDTTKGTLSPEMADYARQFVTTQMSTAAQNKADRTKEYAAQLSQDSGMDPDTAYRQLTGTAPGSKTKTPAGPASFQTNQMAGTAQTSNPPSKTGNSNQVPTAKDTAALQALKSMDPSSPKAFQLRAILRQKGLMQ